MPNYRRANIAGGTYFFTVNTFRRRPILTEAPPREAIQLTRIAHPFDICVYACDWGLADAPEMATGEHV